MSKSKAPKQEKQQESTEVVHKVQATLMPQESAFLPKTMEEFKQDLPESKEECLRSLVSNVAYAQKQNALRMWFVGKIVSTLQDRGEADVFEAVTAVTGFKQRSLYQCIAVYKEFADPEYIGDLGKLLTWTNVRNLLNIKNPEKRKKVCDRVMEGELTDGNVKTAIDTVVAEEKKEKAKEKAEAEGADGEEPEEKVKKVNPSVVLTKIEDYFLRTKKNLQEFEAEYMEIMKFIWNPELSTQEDLYKHGLVADRVVEALKQLEKEIKSMVPPFQKILETDPFGKPKD